MHLKIDNSKTKTKKDKKGKKALLVLVFLFSLYVVFQIFNSVFSKITTEIVGYGSATESLSTQGIIIRNETLIASNGSGVISYLVRDGEKVAIGSKIASYYSSKEDINSINLLNVIDKQIESYESINSSAGLGSADPIGSEAEIGKNIKEIINYNFKGDFHSAYDIKNNIVMLINGRRLLSGEVANFDSEIAQLKDKRAQITASVGSVTRDVYTDTSGYFLKNTDGFENIISANSMSSYDVPALNDLLSAKSQSTDQNVIGKVVSDFEFYYSTVVDSLVADKLKTGQSVEIVFASLENQPLPAEISRISKAYDGKCVVDFKCNYMSKCLNLERKQKAEIIIKTYTGIKVPQGAVRMVDDQMGVYILAGTQARFKKIETVFLKDGYYIVKQDNTNAGSLLIYDAVIVRGNDLYNGKIVK
jgi:putative membrane fusion protein